MKALYALTFLAVLGLSSCSKDYTCTCTTRVTDAGGSVISSNSSASVLNGTKGKVEEECDKGDAQSSSGGFTTTIDCSAEKR